MPLTATATVPTAAASRYLVQLCTHFAHKIPVEHDDKTGRADFPQGSCHLAAEAGTLRLELSAADEQSLAQIKDVVADHLNRFGWREALAIAWES